MAVKFPDHKKSGLNTLLIAGGILTAMIFIALILCFMGGVFEENALFSDHSYVEDEEETSRWGLEGGEGDSENSGDVFDALIRKSSENQTPTPSLPSETTRPSEVIERVEQLEKKQVEKVRPIRTIYEGDSRLKSGLPGKHWADLALASDGFPIRNNSTANFATGGHTPSQVLESIVGEGNPYDRLTIDGRPSANRVLVCCGINGSTNGSDSTAQYATLVAISKALRKRGFYVEMCTIPKHGAGDGIVGKSPIALNDLIDEVNDLIRAGIGSDFDALVDLDAGFEAAARTLPNPSRRKYYDPNWGNQADRQQNPSALPFYSDAVHFLTENGQKTASAIYAASRIASQK